MPHKSAPTSEKFDRDLYLNFKALDEVQLTVLYSLLKRSIDSAAQLDMYLDNLGKWFLSRERWGTRMYRKMIIRSMNRYTNSSNANLPQQLLAMVCAHEYNYIKRSKVSTR